MIIGGSKKEVIANIKKNIENKEYNKKVEVNSISKKSHLLIKSRIKR